MPFDDTTPADQSRAMRRVREDYIEALELALLALREIDPDHEAVRRADAAYTAVQAENLGAREILGGDGDIAPTT